ncbi:MAG TPA: peptidoglycan DD-metalloendopeptidase family protein [Acidimicrobiales bacterium]|nr:peptidoglycan DD-metalloendopeptidase family protein [Acidimicrobiales bacterium]
MSEASAEEAAVLDQLDGAEGRRRQLDARVGELDGQMAAVRSEAEAAEARLDTVQADFVRTQMELGDARGRLTTAQAELRAQAVSAYLGNPSASAADSLLRSANLRELAATSSYLESVAEARGRVVERFRSLRDSTRALQASVEARRDEAKGQRDVVLARRSALEGVRSELDATRTEVKREEAGRQAVLDGVRARVDEFEAQIATLQGDSDSVTGLLQGMQTGGVGAATPAAGSGVLRRPLGGAALSSMFGPRVHPIFGTVRMHNGVDFRGSTGTPIMAAGGGTVVYAGPRGGYGNTVVIDHGGSLATLYAHQSTVYVSVGATVAPGQVIGAVGSTGFSTGPHLHFEVRLGGTPVNPLGYL